MVLVAIVMVQIVFRYGLNNSLSWTEEVAKTLMVWLAMLAAPWAWRAGAQIRVTLFHEAFSPRVRAGVDIVLTLVALWVLGVLFIEAIDLFERGLTARAATVPVPTAVFYAVLPPAFIAMMLVGAEQLMGAVVELQTGRSPLPPPHTSQLLPDDPEPAESGSTEEGRG